MVLILTLADIANVTIFSDRIPESVRLLVFAAALVASAAALRRILTRLDDRKTAGVAENK